MIKNDQSLAWLSSASAKMPVKFKLKQSVNKRQHIMLASLLLGAALLSGCDSQSATFSMIDAPMDEAAAETASPSAMGDQPNQANAKASRDTEIAAEPENHGQSLLAAAKTDDNPAQNMATRDNRSDASLHATLIGDYEGMLPCSFCEGTMVTLNLFSDGSVIKTSVFEAPETPTPPLSESGVYQQDNNKIIIAYEDKSVESFEIQDNHLVMMGDDKQPNPDYMLSRK